MQRKRNWIARLATADNIVLLLSLLLLLGYVVIEVLHRAAPVYSVNAVLRALMLALICLIFYCGGRLRLARVGDKRLLRRLFFLFFVFYLYLILTFTLMDESLGRGGDFIYNNAPISDLRAHYMKWFVNLIPFRSIYEVYILGFVKGYVNTYYVLLNLLGNVCAFMPFSFFLPLFCKKMRRWYVFLPTIITIVAIIEALQFTFMVGSCDVDDLILNAGGAFALYLILRIPKIQKLCASLLVGCFE